MSPHSTEVCWYCFCAEPLFPAVPVPISKTVPIKKQCTPFVQCFLSKVTVPKARKIKNVGTVQYRTYYIYFVDVSTLDILTV